MPHRTTPLCHAMALHAMAWGRGGTLIRHACATHREALLKRSSELGARHQRPDIQGNDSPAPQASRRRGGDDELSNALHNCRLAHARVADQDWVVFGAPQQHLSSVRHTQCSYSGVNVALRGMHKSREVASRYQACAATKPSPHLERPLNHVLPADQRVRPPVCCILCEVSPVPLQHGAADHWPVGGVARRATVFTATVGRACNAEVLQAARTNAGRAAVLRTW